MQDSSSDALRERTRQQILDSFGGWSGTVVSAVPFVVFVIVNATAGLRPAVVAAVASGVLLGVYRLIRRQPLQQVFTGIFSVAIAAAIAARTGQARGFFLLGIVSAFVYGGVFLISFLVRRPLVGALWEFLDPSVQSERSEQEPWYRVPVLLRAYDVATLAVTAMFALRALVQLRLFNENKTGWLAVAKLVLGYPLYIVVVGFCFWVGTRARRSYLGLQPDSGGSADSSADSGLGVGERDEQ